TVTIDSVGYLLLKSADVSISGQVITAMTKEARRRRAVRWLGDSEAGMAVVAGFLEANGSLGAEYWEW
ncbi:type II toxin-antitoxin system CcdA family antitoxin, partial [Salmonella enterica subsp. enterica serovar Infantis]